MKLLLIIYTFLLSFSIYGQTPIYGNEWINNNQPHYKVKIARDGFYFIDKTILTRDIPGINLVNPQTIHIYNMGREIPVHIDIVNNEINTISFYATKNNGEFDKKLYRKENHHLNPEYSMITDTASYFITWGSTINNNQYDDYISNFNNIPPKESFFIHESKLVLSNKWNMGKFYNYGGYILSNGTYDFGEGFAGDFVRDNLLTIETPFLSLLGNSPEVNIRGYASGHGYHIIQTNIGTYTQTLNTFYGDSVINLNFNISHNDILNNTLVNVKGLQGTNDKIAISRVSIKYPRTFNFNGESIFKFNIKASPNRKYLEITNFNGAAQNVYLYDLTNKERIQCYWDNTTSIVHAELPYSTADRELVLLNESSKIPVHFVQRTNFTNYNIARGNYIIITHPNLFTDSNGNNPIFDYAAYRTTTGQMPVIVNVVELYEQFGYGIYGHPLAIRNFVSFIKQNWQTIKPENIFLIGKGRIYNQIRNTQVTNNLIPTFGTPPSDNLLIAPPDSDVPMLPIGRLSATTGDDVTAYLNKVKTLENSATDSLDFGNQLWRNRVIHLGGGANVWEQNILKNHLLDIEQTINKGKFGADVYSFFKEQDNHVSIPNTLLIDSLINNGVSMITFFGHGSTKGFDFYLNSPEYYNNNKRYPLLVALGCYNGTIFSQDNLLSERFILKENGGSIGYIGFVDAVTISAASNISKTFYEKINSNYTAGIGELLQKTLIDFTSTSNYSYNAVFQMGSQYLVFHGDPAIKLNYRNTPDFYIDSSSVTTASKNDTEFILNFELYNLGKYIDTTITVLVQKENPNGKIDSIIIIINTKDKSSIQVIFDINGYKDFGLNKFTIKLDNENAVNELPLLAEQNNIHTFTRNIGNPVIVPIYPRNYEIISDSIVNLTAMISNGATGDYTWYIEFDTVKTFDSPLLIQTSTTTSLLNYTPNLNLTNDIVYYWRVQVLDDNQQLSDWVNNSFTYKSDIIGNGWGQSHTQQFKENEFSNIYINDNGTFKFVPSLYEISAKTGYIGYGIDNENLALYQNGSKVDKCRCSYENGIYVAVLDPTTLNFWTMPGGSTKYGAINCDGANRTAYSFLFKNNTSTGQNNFENFVMDSIPDGHRVIIYTLNNGYGGRWSTTFINHLKNQGATKIDSFTNTNTERSYAFAYKKGDNTFSYNSENIGLTKNESINVFTIANKKWDNGQMKSEIFGPAKSWSKLEWESINEENPYPDSISIDVLGINKKGEEIVLFSDIKTDTLNLVGIDAEEFPYIQLVLNNKDIIHFTPGQLKYWNVYGEPVNDIAITSDKNYEIKYDSVNHQKYIEMDLAVWNFGLSLFDSLELTLEVEHENMIQNTIARVDANDSIMIKVNIPLLGLINQKMIIANIKTKDKEKTLNNNWLWLNIDAELNKVITDIVNSDNDRRFTTYPNPFIKSTTINFDYNETNILKVYNTLGIIIKEEILYDSNKWVWDGTNDSGEKLQTGTYMCNLNGDRNIKITLVN